MEHISDIQIKKRVLSVISKLKKDHFLKKDISRYKKGIKNKETWFDSLVVINWYVKNFNPKYYLEIGVRRGRSMSVALSEPSIVKAYGFDSWIEDYASIPEQSIVTGNPGEEFVINELEKMNISNLPVLITGKTIDTLHTFFSDLNNPQMFDLILVDGDHTEFGAIIDLDMALEHLSPGGCLIFDDIRHPLLPDLRKLWDCKYKINFANWLFIDDESEDGTGVVFRPPFDHIKEFIK